MSSQSRSDQLEADELAHAISGAGAGALSMAVTYPLVTISTKLQSVERKQTDEKKRTKRSAKEVIKDIYDNGGILGFYSGLESAIYGITITNFVYYYFYELVTKSIKKAYLTDKLNTAQSITGGAIAGCATAVASNPIWIANTRMTVTKSEKSTFATILQIIREDGPLALLNGLKPALVLVLNPVIQYTVFEQLKNTIFKIQEKKHQKQVLTPLSAFFLGALGKFVATWATYPYLTLKTRLHLAGNKTLGGTGDGEERQFKVTMLSEALKILREDGFSGFYSGIGYKLVQSILTAAFLFFFKEGLVMWSVRLLILLRHFIMARKKTLKGLNIA